MRRRPFEVQRAILQARINGKSEAQATREVLRDVRRADRKLEIELGQVDLGEAGA